MQEQLDRIEAKLDYILGKLDQVETVALQAAPILLNHPMVKPLLKSLGL